LEDRLIQSIELQNFQSHAATCLDLHPGLNVLTGQGDSGKSAILRAIRWNQSNRIRHDDRPMGDSYVSDWAKSIGAKGATTLLEDCRVTIAKPEGTCSRFREAPKGKGDKERNGYDLNGQRFEAIGVTVPDPVTQFFNWSPVNVQRQQDKAFLLSESAGEVASFLNRTVRLDAIDTHIQAANQLLRQEKDGLKLLQSKQADDQSALEALAWVPGVQVRLEALEALVQARGTLGAKAQRLHGIADQIEAQERRIRESERIASLEPKVREMRRVNDWRRGLMDQRRRLQEVADQWERWERGAKSSEAVARLGARTKGLRGLVERREAVDWEGQKIGSIVLRWEHADRAIHASEGIVSLEPRAKALRALVDQRKALGLRATLLRDLVERWSSVSVSDFDWEAMARNAKVLRARFARAQGVRERAAELRSLRLTFADLATTILETGRTVAKLVALRPETCPLCGGPMHKGEHS
jgi:DNA repair protein SbcC/Rad50